MSNCRCGGNGVAGDISPSRGVGAITRTPCAGARRLWWWAPGVGNMVAALGERSPGRLSATGEATRTDCCSPCNLEMGGDLREAGKCCGPQINCCPRPETGAKPWTDTTPGRGGELSRTLALRGILTAATEETAAASSRREQMGRGVV